jgi:hypothetical protein
LRREIKKVIGVGIQKKTSRNKGEQKKKFTQKENKEKCLHKHTDEKQFVQAEYPPPVTFLMVRALHKGCSES